MRYALNTNLAHVQMTRDRIVAVELKRLECRQAAERAIAGFAGHVPVVRSSSRQPGSWS